MKLIKYPRRYEWENLFDSGKGSIHIAIYTDDAADPAKIAHIILRATDKHHCVVVVSSYSLLIEALLDEIDKYLINMYQKQLEIAAFNDSACVLVKNERVAIELLRTIHPLQLLLYCVNSETFTENFKNTNVVIANNMDNIL